MNRNDALRTILESGLSPLSERVDAGLLDEIEARFRVWAAAGGHDLTQPGDAARGLVQYLMLAVQEATESIAALHVRHAEFSRRCLHAATDAERRQHILDYAEQLGADDRQLRGDRRAFARWLGYDAMADRYARRVAAAERNIAFFLERLGVAAASALEDVPADERLGEWRSLDIERVVRPLLAHDGDSRVRLAVMRCLSSGLMALPEALRASAIEEGSLQFVFRCALDPRQDVWVQCEALTLLHATSQESLDTALRKRLTEPRGKDDLFVRGHAVRLLCANANRIPALVELIPIVFDDASPFVRQRLARSVADVPEEDAAAALRQLAREDDSPQVRASALLELAYLGVERPTWAARSLSILADALRVEKEVFVLRTVCKAAADAVQRLIDSGAASAAWQWHDALVPELERLHQSAESLAVRRWAAQARERIWCETCPEASSLKHALSESLRRIRPGRRGSMPVNLFRGHGETLTCRVLAVLCQEDFGLDIAPGMFRAHVVRGHRMGFRAWRLWHECLRPAPDKRQAFSHTTGRLFSGSLRVPSGILSELSETRVPGEPLFMDDEAGWRPYLPLVDEILATLDTVSTRRPLRIFTAEGITEVCPPRWAFGRFLAWLRLSFGFARYARLRNWEEKLPHGPATYADALRRLGFRVAFRPHSGASGPLEDPSVRRFLPAGVWLSTQDTWARIRDYFFSVYENSLFELVVFAAAAAVAFFGRIVYLSHVVRRARAGIPLVIGGWGTRGKSGTERLKAAIFNAYGCGVFSKTTGCEPMFLHAHPFGPLRDMLLFRPYEKATIWEQVNVVRLARRLGVHVMLWECMALTPAFVRVLQRQWMRDDAATITNAYPDHEDLQGPAGIDVAESIAHFVPPNALLFSSEEQMQPILSTAADAVGTKVRTVTWLEAGLLTPDVLGRFPYEEHPSNVALVLELAKALGIPADFALKEMGDRVVPDIGVLKAYPWTRVAGRCFEFINGMSANERYGTLGNWRRMGFFDHDLEKEPGIWVSTLVNNRADRVARSRVFSRLLVHDVPADSHCLIGTNLAGFAGYLAEDWALYAKDITLWPESDASPDPHAAAESVARRLRMPTSAEAVRRRLEAMIEGLGVENAAALAAAWNEPAALVAHLESPPLAQYAADILRHAARWREYLEAYESLMRRVEAARETRHALDAAFRALLGKWFQSKFVIVDDAHASGEKTLEKIIAATPPGLKNRIMGMQNIKGAGLNFVYCWQAWDRCRRACDQLRAHDPGDVNAGLRALAAFQDYGRLCEAYVRETIEVIAHKPIAQTERFQAELAVIRSNLETALRRAAAQLAETRRTGWIARAIGAIEAFLDAGDAVKRRKLADKIYEDLVNERIGHERANRELQAIQYRERGGWLQQALERLQARFTPDAGEGTVRAVRNPAETRR